MSAVIPKPPILRSANYDESATYGDLTAVFKWMIENHIRYSLTSPPLLKDVKEGTCVLDKTLLRIYFTVDGTLRYLQLT